MYLVCLIIDTLRGSDSPSRLPETGYDLFMSIVVIQKIDRRRPSREIHRMSIQKKVTGSGIFPM